VAKKLKKKEAKIVIDLLMELYPDAKAELEFTNPFELLIATILSAQCTDVQVNKTTRVLFKELKTPEDYIKLTEDELGSRIKSCGFYNTKSRNILAACNILVDKYNGKVPENIEELMELPGVGSKAANVVVSNAFGATAVGVDTPVFRVSNRIGLANSDNVLDTEKDLMGIIEKSLWSKAHHLLIFHGRRICKARKPLCEKCPLTEYCIYYRNGGK